MHWFLGGFGLLWYAGLVSQLVGEQDPLSMIVQAAGGTILLALAVFLWRARARDADLMAWLLEHQQHGTYQGRDIRPDTKLHYFEAVISLVVITVKVRSRLHVDQEPRGGDGVVCLLTTLLLGWWGIPWGPIWTVKSVAQTLGGGLSVDAANALRD
jgi:hypothetical protein